LRINALVMSNLMQKPALLSEQLPVFGLSLLKYLETYVLFPSYDYVEYGTAEGQSPECVEAVVSRGPRFRHVKRKYRISRSISFSKGSIFEEMRDGTKWLWPWATS